VYAFEVRTIGGQTRSLEEYRGQVLLIVNVASHCGYTPQYGALEALYRNHSSRGLVVLGFPCNQFGGQEPGSDDEIARFCAGTYNVTFPMFAKIDVNGPDAHPLYRFLKSEQRGILGLSRIWWNFTKFLVDRRGRPIGRYGPRRSPQSIVPAVDAALAEPVQHERRPSGPNGE
jgi:glutathione peroxidase